MKNVNYYQSIITLMKHVDEGYHVWRHQTRSWVHS